MTRPIMILGTGGGAHDVLDVIEAINACRPTWNVVGFLDDARPKGSRHLGLEVLGPLFEARRHGDCSFVNAIGGEKSYRLLPEILASTGLGTDLFTTLIHPSASVSHRARLGRGVLVNHGVAVGGGTVVGDCITLGPGAIVGHDSVVGDHSVLAPGAVLSGLVVVDRNCYIGARAVIRQGLRIGEQSLVGMGAVVVREVDSGSTVVGNPARPLKRAEDRSNGFQEREHR
jgi:sugar O-acyltransferase (sialic acid O-acetyltransferase NeuD family)